MSEAIAVYVERGDRRAFVCAVDWPGWCRSGRNEDQALEAFAAYAPRYAVVAREAGARFPKDAGDALDVVQRVKGSASTDFGIPGEPCAADARPLTRAQAARQARLLAAAWTVFDRVVAGAPASLRKGPRGGGRDRDKIVQHVTESEAGYARQIGLKLPVPDPRDRAAVAAFRDELVVVLKRPSDGAPLKERGWRPRYALRRIAWHALDHAWEIEDRSE